MTYKLAIFDFDGTLADSFPWFLNVVNNVADRHGFKRVEDHEVGGLRGQEARKILDHVGVPMWKLPMVVRDVRARMAADIDSISLFPGVDDMLEHLSRCGITLALVSSNSPSNVRRVLGERNTMLISHFECGAALFGKRAKIRRVLRASGIAPSDAISIGDEIRDIQAAHAEKISFGAVSWGFNHPASFTRYAPTETFTSMAEIKRRVGT